MKEPAPGIVAEPHEDNLRYFEVVMDGPVQSPYESKNLSSPSRVYKKLIFKRWKI